jgi:hypothetical protein
MTEQNTLREADNTVVIEGTLVEIRHSEWKSKEGLNIELDIEVRENEVHTVYGMSRYKKKDGSDNGVAKGYKTIVDEYKSIASHGREEADKVRVTQGSIGLNEYYGQDDKLKSFPQVNTNFVNRLTAAEEFNPRAEFDVEVFVKSVAPEIKNEDETGRVKLQGIIPVYGGKVIPFTFLVSQEGSEYVQDNYEVGQTVRVYGDIINFKETKKTEQAVAFGKPKEKVTYNTVREYVITGGDEPYEEDNVNTYSLETIQKAMVERETYLAEMKAKKDQPKQEDKKAGFGNKGTGTTGDKKPKKDIVLPF